MLFILIFIAVIFYCIGILINKDNASYLLSGYNTMSDAERASFDIEGYLTFHRKFFTFLGASILFSGLPVYFLGDIYLPLVLGIYPLLAFLFFFYKSQKYNRNKKKWTDYLFYIIIIPTLFFITYSTVKGFQDASIFISNNIIKINGQYGEEFPIHDVKHIRIVKSIPEIRLRTHGLASGYLKKGNFNTKNGEKIKLFITTKQPSSYLEIAKIDGQRIFIATKGTAVEEMYRQLKEALPK